MELGPLGPCCLSCGRSPHDGPCPPRKPLPDLPKIRIERDPDVRAVSVLVFHVLALIAAAIIGAIIGLS